MFTMENKSRPVRWSNWKRSASRGLGIDIGQSNTKVVWAERVSGRGIEVASATIPTNSRKVDSNESAVESTASRGAPGTSEKRQKIATAIVPGDMHRAGWSKLQIKQMAQDLNHLLRGRSHSRSAHVGLSLSMSVCDYRTIYVPKEVRVTAKGLQQTLATATGDGRARTVAVLPTTENHQDEKQVKIRCLSIPEDLTWSIAQELDSIGVPPRILDGLPWCMANALELIGRPSATQKISVAIDWSFGEPTLVSVKNGLIDYVRCLSSGGVQQLISQAVADFRMTAPEATRWIQRCLQMPANAIADVSALETRDWVVECCIKLAAEIGTALDFIRWRNQGCELEAVWLMGGGAQIGGLREILASQLPVELRNWEYPSENCKLSADYATAAALAFLGMHHA